MGILLPAFTSPRSVARPTLVLSMTTPPVFRAVPSFAPTAKRPLSPFELLALALAETGGRTEVAEVKRAVTQVVMDAPQGAVRIDPETLHAFLTPRIGRSTSAMRFEILAQAPGPVRPDPYLIWNSPRFWTAASPPALRVAS